MGPSPKTSRDKDIFQVRDLFTKWYQAIPMSNQEASTVAKAFVNRWFLDSFSLWTSLVTRAVFFVKYFQKQLQRAGNCQDINNSLSSLVMRNDRAH